MINSVEKKEVMYERLSKTIKNQVSKLDELDKYTMNHIHSVPMITKRICEKLEFTEECTQFCIKCAYLHDIGKIFIPPEILQKKEELNKEEYEIMKTHTTKGYDLCMATENLSDYAYGARSHHENENGTRIPRPVLKEMKLR